jgi:hypothetical protein
VGVFCGICGKPVGFLASIVGGKEHPACVLAQAEARLRVEAQEKRELHQRILSQIRAGTFLDLSAHSEMMLDPGEACCLVIKGVWSTMFYPRAAGRIKPGQTIRVDGLKKSDFGTLHATNKRVCFVGKGGAKVMALKKILQCESHADVLHLTAEGRSSSTYFILEDDSALELAREAILKLTSLSKTGVEPTIQYGG